MPDMARSLPYDSFAKNPVTRDGKTLQAPVAGTVPRGFLPFRYQRTAEDATRAGQELLDPTPETPERVARGKVLYETFCLVCHGQNGRGDGPLVPRIPNPPAYSSERVRCLPAGPDLPRDHAGLRTHARLRLPDLARAAVADRGIRADPAGERRVFVSATPAMEAAAPLVLPARYGRLAMALMAAGVLAVAAGLWQAPQRTWANLLLGNLYLLSIGLFGALFLCFQFLSGAGWCAALRRVAGGDDGRAARDGGRGGHRVRRPARPLPRERSGSDQSRRGAVSRQGLLPQSALRPVPEWWSCSRLWILLAWRMRRSRCARTWTARSATITRWCDTRRSSRWSSRRPSR